MGQTLSEFANVVEDPYRRLAQWKKCNDGRVIGCYPMYVPEEIIHAAGMLPAIIFGGDEDVSQADKYLPLSVCHLVRGTLDIALKGEMDFLDGLIFPDICEAIQMTADIWGAHRPSPFHYSLVLPMNLTLPLGKKYLIEQFDGLRVSLGKFFGVEISEQSIQHSIVVYNHNRALLNRLYDLRRASPDLFNTREVATIVTASMLMPKEEHSQLLERYLGEAEGMTQPSSSGKVKLVLSGCLCDRLEESTLDLLDEVGVIVPDDDLYVGSRYFSIYASEDMPPIEALAERYIKDVPCPTKYNPANDWADHLLGIVKRSEADGVVILMLKYCEPHALDYPYLKERLSQAGVPHLFIETEHDRAPLGQIRTRLEAFKETLDRKAIR